MIPSVTNIGLFTRTLLSAWNVSLFTFITGLSRKSKRSEEKVFSISLILSILSSYFSFTTLLPLKERQSKTKYEYFISVLYLRFLSGITSPWKTLLSNSDGDSDILLIIPAVFMKYMYPFQKTRNQLYPSAFEEEKYSTSLNIIWRSIQRRLMGCGKKSYSMRRGLLCLPSDVREFKYVNRASASDFQYRISVCFISW